MGKTFNLHIPISKIDEEQRMVWGVATSEAIDSQNDIVDYAASKTAFPAWLGNIREMHQPVAVGKAIDIQFDDDKKEVMIGAKISESADGENAWIKVKEGVLQGFSIGGNIKQIAKEVAKDKNGNDTPVTRIVDYDLSEVSLVDNPANPEAMLVMVKSAKGGLQRTEHMATEAELKKAIVPGWFMQFTPPIEKAQALYDKGMSKKLEKAGVAVVDSDPRDAAGNTVTEVKTNTPVKDKTPVVKPVYARDGRTVTNKAKDSEMKKGLWDASFLLDLAIDLSYYIQSEEYEGEDVTDLNSALATIKQAVVDELTEPTSELTVAVELAQKVINLKKGKTMSEDKKVEKSTAVAGGEERDANAEVVSTAEQNGRPVNDTQERAEEAGVPVATDTKTDEEGNEVPVGNVAEGEAAPAADEKKTEEPAKTETKVEVKTDEGAKADEAGKPAEGEADGKSTAAADEAKTEDSEKAVTVGDLRKFTEGLISKLGDTNKEQLSKVLGEFSDKVESDLSVLKGRLDKLEDQPAAPKAKASFVDIEKGKESGSGEEADVAALLKRRDELMANPNEGTPQERMELAMKLRKAQAAGAVIA